jgi:hypothetical protein
MMFVMMVMMKKMMITMTDLVCVPVVESRRKTSIQSLQSTWSAIDSIRFNSFRRPDGRRRRSAVRCCHKTVERRFFVRAVTDVSSNTIEYGGVFLLLEIQQVLNGLL